MTQANNVKSAGYATSSDYAHIEAIARSVAQIVTHVTGDPAFRVLLFGSWAEGTARPRSDIDVAIDGGCPVQASHLAAIREACDRLPTLFTIDLVDLARTSAEFRETVRGYARVVAP